MRKIRKVWKYKNDIFLYLINALWAIPLLIVVRVIVPFVHIRFGRFYFDRVGHFAADVGRHRAQYLLDESKKTLDFWYLPDDNDCSNAYWAQITRKWFRVHSLVRYLFFWSKIIPFGGANRLNSMGDYGSRDVFGFIEKAKLKLPTGFYEEAKAKKWMAQFGWKEGDPFICLLVRDSAYMKQTFSDDDYSYHDYRNSDVQTYIKAIDYLTSNGVFVLRMGRGMNSRVEYTHDKFIDYAFDLNKSDFLDVWLFANCSLCITTGSGPDMISDVFRRPLLVVNYLPLQLLFSWSNAVHYPKILNNKNSSTPLSLIEYLDQTHLYKSDYDRFGLEIVDLNEDQICEAVKEGWQRVLGEWKESELEAGLHEQFRKILKNHREFKNYHNFIHPEMRLAYAFLSKVDLNTSRETF